MEPRVWLLPWFISVVVDVVAVVAAVVVVVAGKLLVVAVVLATAVTVAFRGVERFGVVVVARRATPFRLLTSCKGIVMGIFQASEAFIPLVFKVVEVIVLFEVDASSGSLSSWE